MPDNKVRKCKALIPLSLDCLTWKAELQGHAPYAGGRYQLHENTVEEEKRDRGSRTVKKYQMAPKDYKGMRYNLLSQNMLHILEAKEVVNPFSAEQQSQKTNEGIIEQHMAKFFA
ncbi:hypothetical protein DV515_00006166 [Chloebia gouldiae]|uniref:Uncharacterized protein n=1 Tax=Chloebia gouldiae TaxID=44316 RepID=A0A3L8SM54_CHLGU|nr:hypothetical protein DV515_00006166 [Chloebia gouldiae]